MSVILALSIHYWEFCVDWLKSWFSCLIPEEVYILNPYLQYGEKTPPSVFVEILKKGLGLEHK